MAATKETSAPEPAPTPEGTPEHRRVRILVSSAVLGYEDFLESIYALLENFDYEILMSHKGTIEIDPNISAMDSCVETRQRACHRLPTERKN